jgi:hypothetical protein
MKNSIYFIFLFVATFTTHFVSAQNTGKVGLIVEKDEYSGFMMVTTVEPYTPAFKSAIQQDDLILAVDGKDTKNQTAEDVMKWLEGEVGTEVKVTVKAGKREYVTTLKRISRGGAQAEAKKENLPNQSENTPLEVEQVEMGTCANVQKLLGQALKHFDVLKESELEVGKKWKSRISLLGNAMPLIYKEGNKEIFEQVIFQGKEKSAAGAAALMFTMELDGCQFCLKKYVHTSKKEGETEIENWYNGAIMLSVIQEKHLENWVVSVKVYELSGY